MAKITQKRTIGLGETVIVNYLITTHSPKVNLKLGHKGLVRALKLTTKNLKILMVEFKDNTRIWFFEQEVNLI